MAETRLDAIVVGGGPAGLSAALMLGRCRRRVLVLDEGKPRNVASRALHGFLSRDGVPPGELLRIGREQLAHYDTVRFEPARVVGASRDEHGFTVTTADGRRFDARRLVLATGVVDHLPDVLGLRELYGTSIFHCPYCDAWEVRDEPLAVYGRGDGKGGGLALMLVQWSRDVVLCTDGPSELTERHAQRLLRAGISVREDRILRLEGQDGILERIVFERGPDLPRRALFFSTGRHQASDLARTLGCELYEDEGCRVEGYQSTTVPGLFVIGDASRDVLQAIVGAAEGAEAAIAINKSLFEEDGP